MRCAVLDDYQGVALSLADWSRIADRVEVTAFRDHIAGNDALGAALTDFEIVVAMRERTPFDRSLLEVLPKLELLVTTGMANASIDLDAAAERRVTVCGTRSIVGPAAELAWGLILALLRHIPEEHAATRAGEKWQSTLGIGLAGKTLGVIGVGRLGSRVIRVARAFEMRVLAWSRSLTPEQAAALEAEHCASLGEVLAGSDIVSLHLSLTPQTHRIIGAAEIARMRPGAFLINTARGPLVDEAALIHALREKRLAGAGLDVYDVEPLPATHPFRTLDNVVTTPHIGYVTIEAYRRYFADAVEDIEAWLQGRPMRLLTSPG